jgi:hypothetical protein
LGDLFIGQFSASDSIPAARSFFLGSIEAQSCVVTMRQIFQVAGGVVRSYVVFMINVHPFRSWPDETQSNESVDSASAVAAVPILKPNMQVPTSVWIWPHESHFVCAVDRTIASNKIVRKVEQLNVAHVV